MVISILIYLFKLNKLIIKIRFPFNRAREIDNNENEGDEAGSISGVKKIVKLILFINLILK